MGVCIGGTASIMAAWEPIRKIMGDYKFVTHIALYPFCYSFTNLDFSGAPILIMSGEKDNWVPASTCVDLAQNLKTTGYPIETIVYPGANHIFDAKFNPTNITINSPFNCRFNMESDGLLINTTNGLDSNNPDYISSCREKSNVTVGSNSKAKKMATIETEKMVSEVFGIH
jgi:dienelactone hydrolase